MKVCVGLTKNRVTSKYRARGRRKILNVRRKGPLDKDATRAYQEAAVVRSIDDVQSAGL